MFPLINTRLMPCYVQRPKMKIFIISQSRKNRACYYYLFIIIHVFALFILSNRLGLNPQCTRSHALAEQRADPVHFFKGGRWKRGGGQKWYIFRPKREKTSAPKLADFLQNTCNNNDSKINDEKKIITPFIPPPNSTNLVNHLDAPLHLFNSTCATLLVWINLSHTCNIEFVKTY